MLTINERNRVYGEDIHIAIQSKNKNYRSWINGKIYYADLQEGKDYFSEMLKSTGGRPKTQYEFTLDAAKKIALVEQSKNGMILYRYLCQLDNVEVLYEPRTRKELLFEMVLNEILEGITKVIPQYPILNYRIDFYLPEINLAIEYDGKEHSTRRAHDNKRQKEIESEIKFIKFIRVDEGNENVGINLILKYLFHIAYWKYEQELSNESNEFMFLKKFDVSILDDCGKTMNERINDIFIKGV